MKTKGILTKRFGFQPNELDAVAEFLEQKAAEGWGLSSKVGETFCFRRCEPRKVKISVELVETDGEYGNKQQFIEYCESVGWKHIFSDDKFQFFENEDMEAEPIHTDPKVKLDLIYRKTKLRNLSYGLTCIWLIFLVGKSFSAIDFASISHMVLVFGLPIICVLYLAQIVEYMKWYRESKRKIEKGETPTYKRLKIGSFTEKCCICYLLVACLGGLYSDAIYAGKESAAIIYTLVMLAIIGFMEIYPRISAKRNNEGKADIPFNYFYAFVVGIFMCLMVSVFVEGADKIVETPEGGTTHVSTYEIPLTLEDLGVQMTSYIDRYRVKKASPLLKYYHGYDSSYNENENYIYYNIYKTKYERIYSMALEECWAFPEYFYLVDEPEFNAKEVYTSGNSDWVLLYENAIVEISTDIELTDEQKQIVVEKLTDYI